MSMVELSLDNHFCFSYEGRLFAHRESPQDHWSVEYGRTSQLLDFRSACISQAKTIYEKANGRVGLLLSGGIDSEVILLSFLAAGLPVRAYIGQMNHDYNLHDICYAIMACEKHNVPYTLIKYDFEKVLSEKALDYAQISQCFSPQLIAVMYLMDQVDEYVVVGGGDCVFKKDTVNGEKKWFLFERERVASWYKFLLARNRSACPGFFQYSPELIYAYANAPFIKAHLLSKSSPLENIADFKLDFYQRHFPLISRKKKTGFETIQHLDYKFRSELFMRFNHCDTTFKTEYSRFLLPASPVETTKPDLKIETLLDSVG